VTKKSEDHLSPVAITHYKMTCRERRISY